MNTAKSSYRFFDWFVQYWSRTALPGGLMLLALSPLIYRLGGLPLLLTYLLLPAYMIHQYEEHAEGKFKVMANRMLAGGADKITDRPIFWVNIIGVWVVYALAINAAALSAIGFGLIPAYATLVNAVLHILSGIRERAYNPGLITSVILFLPVSLFAIYTLSQQPDTSAYHIPGIGVAIVLHAIMLGYLNYVARH